MFSKSDSESVVKSRSVIEYESVIGCESVFDRMECQSCQVMGFEEGLLDSKQSFIPFVWEVSQPPSQYVWFSTSFSRSVDNSEIEAGEEFRPACLLVVEELC